LRMIWTLLRSYLKKCMNLLRKNRIAFYMREWSNWTHHTRSSSAQRSDLRSCKVCWWTLTITWWSFEFAKRVRLDAFGPSKYTYEWTRRVWKRKGRKRLVAH
jgi:hypothetical protein